MTLTNALVRLDLLVQMITVLHGPPIYKSNETPGYTEKGQYKRFDATWTIGGVNHGVGIDYYRDDLYKIKGWGSGRAFSIDIWTKHLSFPMLIDAAYHVGLLTERE